MKIPESWFTRHNAVWDELIREWYVREAESQCKCLACLIRNVLTPPVRTHFRSLNDNKRQQLEEYLGRRRRARARRRRSTNSGGLENGQD